MSDTEILTAPEGLTAHIRHQLTAKGVNTRRSILVVTPFIQVNPHPNRWTPRGQRRWVAHCPECPGAEVVPAAGLFVCGSCGCEATVDWTER